MSGCTGLQGFSLDRSDAFLTNSECFETKSIPSLNETLTMMDFNTDRKLNIHQMTCVACTSFGLVE